MRSAFADRSDDAHAMGSMQRSLLRNVGTSPHATSRPDAIGDQGVQESGHRHVPDMPRSTRPSAPAGV